MDITLRHYFNTISNYPNKKHWRIRGMIKEINILISEYRLEARRRTGFIKEYCNKEANYLENQLKIALESGRKLS